MFYCYGQCTVSPCFELRLSFDFSCCWRRQIIFINRELPFSCIWCIIFNVWHLSHCSLGSINSCSNALEFSISFALQISCLSCRFVCSYDGIRTISSSRCCIWTSCHFRCCSQHSVGRACAKYKSITHTRWPSFGFEYSRKHWIFLVPQSYQCPSRCRCRSSGLCTTLCNGIICDAASKLHCCTWSCSTK